MAGSQSAPSPRIEPRAEPDLQRTGSEKAMFEAAAFEPNFSNPLQGMIQPVPVASSVDPLQSLIQPVTELRPPQLAPINDTKNEVAAAAADPPEETKGLFRAALADAVKNMLKLHYQVKKCAQ